MWKRKSCYKCSMPPWSCVIGVKALSKTNHHCSPAKNGLQAYFWGLVSEHNSHFKCCILHIALFPIKSPIHATFQGSCETPEAYSIKFSLETRYTPDLDPPPQATFHRWSQSYLSLSSLTLHIWSILPPLLSKRIQNPMLLITTIIATLVQTTISAHLYSLLPGPPRDWSHCRQWAFSHVIQITSLSGR